MSKYIFDSHVHSENSFDGVDSVDLLCQSAIEKGLDGFCITDHLEVNEYDKEYEKIIKKSHDDIIKAIEKYKDKIQLNMGIEMAQPLQNLAMAEKILKDFPCDFIIGSMHNVKDEKDFYFMQKEDFEHRVYDLLDKYYEEYYEMTKWGKFDVIGHITYPLRYIEGIYNMNIDISKYDEIIYEMLKLAVKKDIGIEINVSGFRQPYQRQFPEFKHIKAYVDYGGEIITIGSDAHNIHHIGYNFGDGIELIKMAGLDKYCYFKKRSPVFVKI